MRIILGWFLLSILITCQPSFAELSLKIEYAPQADVLLYEPFLIMISINNSGTKGELVPVTDNSERGYRFHIRDTKTGEVHTNGLDGDRIGTKVTWIKPNDTYLFFEWVYYGIPIEGEFEIFATLESDGKCPLLLSGTEDFPLELLDSQPDVPEYKCWQGKLTSNSFAIKIARPKDETENNVLNKVEEKAPQGAGASEKLSLGFMDVQQTSPLSKYACISSFYVSAEDAYQTCTNKEFAYKDLEILSRFKMALVTITRDNTLPEDETNKMPSVFQDYLKQFQKEHEDQKKRDAAMENK